MKTILKNYSAIILLLGGITIGSLIGIFFPNAVIYLKPLGDIFLNLLFVSVVPLVYFAVANSIAGVEQGGKFGKIILSMIITFLFFYHCCGYFHRRRCLLFSDGSFAVDFERSH